MEINALDDHRWSMERFAAGPSKTRCSGKCSILREPAESREECGARRDGDRGVARAAWGPADAEDRLTQRHRGGPVACQTSCRRRLGRRGDAAQAITGPSVRGPDRASRVRVPRKGVIASTRGARRWRGVGMAPAPELELARSMPARSAAPGDRRRLVDPPPSSTGSILRANSAGR